MQASPDAPHLSEGLIFQEEFTSGYLWWDRRWGLFGERPTIWEDRALWRGQMDQGLQPSYDIPPTPDEEA